MAERIARRVAAGSSHAADRHQFGACCNARDSERIAKSFDSDRVKVSFHRVPRTHSPWLAGVNASHPSLERFGVEEATVSELVDFFQNEKACSLEPGGKPCDHCAMCSSRGF